MDGSQLVRIHIIRIPFGKGQFVHLLSQSLLTFATIYRIGIVQQEIDGHIRDIDNAVAPESEYPIAGDGELANIIEFIKWLFVEPLIEKLSLFIKHVTKVLPITVRLIIRMRGRTQAVFYIPAHYPVDVVYEIVRLVLSLEQDPIHHGITIASILQLDAVPIDMDVTIAHGNNTELVPWLGVDGQEDGRQNLIVGKPKLMFDDGQMFAEFMHQTASYISWLSNTHDTVQTTLNAQKKVKDLAEQSACELRMDTSAGSIQNSSYKELLRLMMDQEIMAEILVLRAVPTAHQRLHRERRGGQDLPFLFRVTRRFAEEVHGSEIRAAHLLPSGRAADRC